MSDLGIWAVRLAQEIAPDEVDLALPMVEAFVAGGSARRDLFSASGSVPGGFGAGELLIIMPIVYKVVASTSSIILTVLSSEFTGTFLECVGNIVAIMELNKQARKESAVSSVPSDPTYASLRRMIVTLEQELQKAGISDDQSEHITLRIVKEFLAEPTSAAGFVQNLSKKK